MLIYLERIPSGVMAIKLLPLLLNRLDLLLDQMNLGLEDKGKLATITYRIQ